MNTPAVVVEAWANICSNYWRDEERHYAETYDEEDPADIKTGDLKSSSYKDMRVIDDFIDAVWFFFVFFVLVLFCLGARLGSSDRSRGQ